MKIAVTLFFGFLITLMIAGVIAGILEANFKDVEKKIDSVDRKIDSLQEPGLYGDILVIDLSKGYDVKNVEGTEFWYRVTVEPLDE